MITIPELLKDLKLFCIAELLMCVVCVCLAVLICTYFAFIEGRCFNVKTLKVPALRNGIIFRFLGYGNLGCTLFFAVVCIAEKTFLVSILLSLLLTVFSFVKVRISDKEKSDIFAVTPLIEQMRREFAKLGYTVKETITLSMLVHSVLAGLEDEEIIEQANEAVINRSTEDLFYVFCAEAYGDGDGFRLLPLKEKRMILELLERLVIVAEIDEDLKKTYGK